MASPLLVIGNRTTSSWSLRAWIAMAHGGMAFDTLRIALDQPDTQRRIREHSPTGRVPVLVDGALTVHDSLAILEYLNETHLAASLLPDDPAQRARVRMACAEMHSGFAALRQIMPMVLTRPPGPAQEARWQPGAAALSDSARILELWEQALAESGGPFLWGAWSMADCVYLPVATRFRTYAVDTSAHPLGSAWMERVLSLPTFLEWEAAAREETDTLPDLPR